jgi:hypothetical protein
MFGPVQDVRIPYQQKRMFGFVAFVYAETVKIILNKGNPHFVCNARVLVKPYREKGKAHERLRYVRRIPVIHLHCTFVDGFCSQSNFSSALFFFFCFV